MAPWRSRDRQRCDRARACRSPRSSRSAPDDWRRARGLRADTRRVSKTHRHDWEVRRAVCRDHFRPFFRGTDCSQKHIPAQGRAWQRRKRIRQSASEIAAVISRILSFSVHQRWLVALLTMAAAAFGVWSMTKLPIDAVPDITSNQVQINTIVPALSPARRRKANHLSTRDCAYWNPWASIYAIVFT